MQKTQTRMTIGLLFTALAVLAFFGTALLSGPIDFLYRDAAGLSTARNAAQLIALIAAAFLLLTGLTIAIPTALQPGNWLRKMLYVLPIYLLGFTLVGVVSTALLGVGEVGTFFNLNGVGPVTLATAWLALGAVLSLISVVIAGARAKLGASTARLATMTTAAASGLSLLAAIAMIVGVVIVATSQPASFGGGGQFPPGAGGGQGQRQNQGRGATTPQSTAEASSGGVPAGQNTAPGQGQSTAEAPSGAVSAGQNAPGGAPGQNNGAPNGQGQPQGQGGPGGGGFPGGPGGGSGNSVRNYEVGGALMALFAVIGVVGTVGALRVSPVGTASQTQTGASMNLPREVGMAILSGVGLTVILIALMQIPPVSHANPPVQQTVKWDTTQTQDLAARACMNCHSNETTWPWYSYIAPSSWLTTLHVTNARQEMNFSELNLMPAFRKSMLADQIAMQIRSGSMPPKDYLLLHPEARLSDTEKEQLITGFQASLAGS